MNWQLWQPGPVERQVDDISPLLASWEKSSHPAQVRLRAYLDDLVRQVTPLPDDGPLYLRLEVDVRERERLQRHFDLENYLTPLFGSRCLPAGRFFLVSATKYVGGGSRITLGHALSAEPMIEAGWTSFSVNAGSGATSKSWKERIRLALVAASPPAVPPGPARVRLAWRCAERRNWCSLWKPTGDAMGSVLGVADARRPYHVNDDRIVDLELHRAIDNSLGNDVEVGMWWRAAENVAIHDTDGDIDRIAAPSELRSPQLSPVTTELLRRLMEQPPRERIAAANALWDSIKVYDRYCGTPDEDAFYDELMRRDAEMEAGINVMTREEFMAEVRRDLARRETPKEAR